MFDLGQRIAAIGLKLGFVIGILYLALSVSEKLSLYGGGGAQKFSNWAAGKYFGGASWGLKRGVSWPAYAVSRSQGLRDKAQEKGIGGTLARTLWRTADRAGRTSFDIRRAPGMRNVSSVLGKAGYDLGTPTREGGYAEIAAAKAKRVEERGRRLQDTDAERAARRRSLDAEFAKGEIKDIIGKPLNEFEGTTFSTVEDARKKAEEKFENAAIEQELAAQKLEKASDKLQEFLQKPQSERAGKTAELKDLQDAKRAAQDERNDKKKARDGYEQRIRDIDAGVNRHIEQKKQNRERLAGYADAMERRRLGNLGIPSTGTMEGAERVRKSAPSATASERIDELKKKAEAKVRSCPPGTHWDTATEACVPDTTPGSSPRTREAHERAGGFNQTERTEESARQLYEKFAEEAQQRGAVSGAAGTGAIFRHGESQRGRRRGEREGDWRERESREQRAAGGRQIHEQPARPQMQQSAPFDAAKLAAALPKQPAENGQTPTRSAQVPPQNTAQPQRPAQAPATSPAAAQTPRMSAPPSPAEARTAATQEQNRQTLRPETGSTAIFDTDRLASATESLAQNVEKQTGALKDLSSETAKGQGQMQRQVSEGLGSLKSAITGQAQKSDVALKQVHTGVEKTNDQLYWMRPQKLFKMVKEQSRREGGLRSMLSKPTQSPPSTPKPPEEPPAVH